jgi:oxygen-independent coproporphyrinogen-3 oxidase
VSTEDLSASPLPSRHGGSPHTGTAGESHTDEALYGNYFVATYPPFSRWTADAVADYKAMLDRPIAADPVPRLGLYVHIPFCVDRCRFCYYLSYERDERGSLDRYVDSLIAEFGSYARRAAIVDRSLDFVYFGGGTPSLLARSSLERLLEGLQRIRPWSDTREVTFECAPKSVTPAKMEMLRCAGITRLSLGVQQLDDEVLVRNGRVHLTRDVEAAYAAVRKAGFPVVNLDLMVGLVGETRETMLRSLERVIDLGPDSVTLYQMEIPLNTPLYRDIESGDEDRGSLADWAEKRRRLTLAFEHLSAAGYQRISAYTMVRDPSRHDFVYQREQYHGADLIGIGASSFGYIQGFHHQNQTALGPYSEIALSGELPVFRAHRLDPEERLVREFVLQLKLGGLRRADFLDKFGVDPVERFGETLEPMIDKGWIVCDAQELRLTREGLPRVDHLIPLFYQSRYRGARYS